MSTPVTIEQGPDGKWKVKRVRSISAVFPALPKDINIQTALLNIEVRVKQEAASVKTIINQNALNNTRGEWFEMFLASRFYNLSKASGRFCVFTIPNVSSIDFTDFYTDDVRARLDELRAHLNGQGIELKMSNPDFLCVDLAKVNASVKREALAHGMLSNLDEPTAEFLDTLYAAFVGQCPFDALKFAVSAKTSVRPDRRYQFVHEGNIIKALTAHLQTRYWKTDFSIGYYALTNEEPTEPDKEVLRTAAISSVTNVFARSVKAVDDLFWIQSLSDVDSFFKRATSN